MKRMVNENLIKLLEDLSSKGITADDIEKAVNKHLYLLTFGSGDFKISILTSSKVDDYTVYDMTSLTDEDKEYFKSLKDIIINEVGYLYGADSYGVDIDYLSGTYNNILYLNLDSYEYEINLVNPVNQSTGDTLEIKFKQLF